MAPWNSSPQIDVRVRFDSEDTSKPIIHAPIHAGDEYITGAATFNLRKNYEIIRYKVVIKGVVQTKWTELAAGGLQGTSSVETHTFLFATLFEGSRLTVLNDHKRHVARVSFKFNLANNHDSSSDSFQSSGHVFRQFLPFIDPKTSGKHWSSTFKTEPDAQYSVTYTIIATPSRQFSYLPDIVDGIPVALEDFLEEHFVRTTKAISNASTSTTRIGMISQEPRVLALYGNLNGGETNISLDLMLLRDVATSFGRTHYLGGHESKQICARPLP